MPRNLFDYTDILAPPPAQDPDDAFEDVSTQQPTYAQILMNEAGHEEIVQQTIQTGLNLETVEEYIIHHMMGNPTSDRTIQQMIGFLKLKFEVSQRASRDALTEFEVQQLTSILGLPQGFPLPAHFPEHTPPGGP
jgi:hypothetical protein